MEGLEELTRRGRAKPKGETQCQGQSRPGHRAAAPSGGKPRRCQRHGPRLSRLLRALQPPLRPPPQQPPQAPWAWHSPPQGPQRGQRARSARHRPLCGASPRDTAFLLSPRAWGPSPPQGLQPPAAGPAHSCPRLRLWGTGLLNASRFPLPAACLGRSVYLWISSSACGAHPPGRIATGTGNQRGGGSKCGPREPRASPACLCLIHSHVTFLEQDTRAADP